MAEPIQGFDYDPGNGHFHYPREYGSRLSSWPLQHSSTDSPASAAMIPKRSTSPLPLSLESHSYQQTATYPSPSIMAEWQVTAPQATPVSFPLDTSSFSQQTYETFGAPFQTSPIEYSAQQTTLEASLEANMNSGMSNSLPMDQTYMAMGNSMPNGINNMEQNINGLTQVPMPWPNFSPDMYGLHNMLPPHPQMGHMGSPSETHISEAEVLSLASSHEWNMVEHSESHHDMYINPIHTIHPRAYSDSSSDNDQHSNSSSDGSYVHVSRCASSPSNDSTGESHFHSDAEPFHYDMGSQSPPVIISNFPSKPIPAEQSSSSSAQHSPQSPPVRSRPRKSNSGSKSAAAAPKGITKRPQQDSKTEVTAKRIGRRKGPLRPDQRKQASEIRKLGACIRCRFLKKTCDKGDPCAGCQPSHARLWLVPCTRIDIKDLGYFLKDWKADYERHVSLGFSVGNIKGFSDKESTLFITHGYGHYLPVQAREVFVRDDKVFGVDWVESKDGTMNEFEVNTARLSAGMEGVSTAMLSDYLDRHIDGGFEYFVDEFFGGGPFYPDILKTVYRFWVREKTPVIRKALKFVLAYNLTQAICLVKTVGSDFEVLEGKVPEESAYLGETAAPVMINFQVKCAMADMWRELQKDLLEELSALYSSIYSRDKLKHWPTIFMLASVLLVVWEEMQFDCRYRIPDAAVVEKFCKDMESTPVGVIVGLFSAISQKVPAFAEWNTDKHHNLLNSNAAVCTAMEEVRDHIGRNEKYLKTRQHAKFDRNDFDCLSNIFVSKLVIRAH